MSGTRWERLSLPVAEYGADPEPEYLIDADMFFETHRCVECGVLDAMADDDICFSCYADHINADSAAEHDPIVTGSLDGADYPTLAEMASDMEGE